MINKNDKYKFKEYCNINFEKDTYHKVIKKFFTTHFIHAGTTFGHFIPNMILTFILGCLLELMVGSVRMLLYILICIFVYWVIIYQIIGSYRKGCGFSSIYFSFVSIYCSLLIIFEQKILYKLLYAIIPFVFLYILNLGGNIFKAHGRKSNYIHSLSILYGYIVGLFELIIYNGK